ncbi:PREDICTED: ermin [Gekko japonicus]|uniref:Ermin n=1 Tax=Gekko japonicus TaxID=146911 RepID=A0ABM1K011_GEKJA|nr:PREDICTED: ermin [Gekko japonicus]
MTEDVQVRPGVPEYNRNMPSEKPQLQVIDIIDQMANSVEIFPYENEEFNPDSLLLQAEQEGADHLVENTACGVSSGEKDYQGLCEENYAISAKAHEGIEQEEGDTQQLWEEKAYGSNETKEDQDEAQLHEHKEQIETETYLEVNENATAEDSEGAEGVMQNENNGESHKKWQETNSEECLPIDPRSNSPTEKPKEQPSSMKKSDISRHSYSRYNTISYRKIRKGNTKQRIDEFESMMHS